MQNGSPGKPGLFYLIKRFTFNINELLSHGWVSYKIKSQSASPIGTVIDNTAYIYFDFNQPVVTNTVITMVDNPAGLHPINVSELPVIFLYPNPVTNELAVGSGQVAMEEIEILNILGEKVFYYQLPITNYQLSINVRQLPPGIYLVRVKTEKGMSAAKFIKE